jgi:hypothetical protein
LLEALPIALGKSLKAIGLVGPSDCASSAMTRMSTMFEENGTNFASLPEVIVSRELVQWYKLHEAFLLMEKHEASNKKFDVVIKLRFDCIPMPLWDICTYSDAMSKRSTLRAIHACTDHVFWGRRDVMEVAAKDTWHAIQEYFLNQQSSWWDPFHRPLYVGAMLGTLLAVPAASRNPETWQHFSKIGTLPYFEIESGDNGHLGYEHMIDHMGAAWNEGMDFVDPQVTQYPGGGVVNLLPGPQSHPVDYTPGVFANEKDFLTWLISRNITVCDIGAGTDAILYKGSVGGRQSAPCRMLVGC